MYKTHFFLFVHLLSFLFAFILFYLFFQNHILKFVFFRSCQYIFSSCDRYFDGFCLSVIKKSCLVCGFFKLFFVFSFLPCWFVALLFNHRKKYPYNYNENSNKKGWVDRFSFASKCAYWDLDQSLLITSTDFCNPLKKKYACRLQNRKMMTDSRQFYGQLFELALIYHLDCPFQLEGRLVYRFFLCLLNHTPLNCIDYWLKKPLSIWNVPWSNVAHSLAINPFHIVRFGLNSLLHTNFSYFHHLFRLPIFLFIDLVYLFLSSILSLLWPVIFLLPLIKLL